jgi:nucleoporin NUP1
MGSSAPRRDRRPTRNNSLVGSLKNLFTGFFRISDPAQDDFEHSNGKRRAVDQSGPDLVVDSSEQYGSRTKKMRVGSPPRSAYLDPPSSAFPPLSRLSNTTIPSTTIPPSNHQHRPPSLSRHTTPTYRTMSMDPPARHTPPSRESQFPYHTSSSVPHMSISRSRDSSMRDVSMPLYTLPRSSSIRMSLTPQPSGPKFGPLALSRQPSEPPALNSLRENPSFVRPPSLEPANSVLQPTVTLGSLVDSQRNVSS